MMPLLQATTQTQHLGTDCPADVRRPPDAREHNCCALAPTILRTHPKNTTVLERNLSAAAYAHLSTAPKRAVDSARPRRSTLAARSQARLSYHAVNRKPGGPTPRLNEGGGKGEGERERREEGGLIGGRGGAGLTFLTAPHLTARPAGPV